MKRILVLMVLAVLFCSCNTDSKQDWNGMEYFTFKISGKVTDASGNPVNGISVSALGAECKTFADGTYVLEGRGGTVTETFVNFSDIDAAENGGLYMGASVNVTLDYIKGQHGPYLGLFGKSDVNIVLQLRQLLPAL